MSLVRWPFADVLARIGSLRRGAVGRLTQGAVMAQLIGLATSPLTARLFSPAESGAAAVFITLLTIPVALASLRLEGAIAVPATREARSAVLRSALLLLPLTALVSLVIFVAIRRPLAAWLEEPRIVEFVWAAPLVVLSLGAFQALSAWATREGLFVELSRIPVSRSVQQLAFQICGGVFASGSAWVLVTGHVVGGASGTLGLWRAMRDRVRSDWTSMGPQQRVRAHLSKFRGFASYGSLGAGLNYAGSGFPLVAIGLLHGPEGAGLYRWGQLLVWIPVTALVSSISSVYSARFASMLNEKPSALPAVRQRMTVRLVGLALVVAVGSLLLPAVVPILLGARWSESGTLAVLSVPAIALSVITTPTGCLPLLGRNDWQLWWEASRLGLMGAAFLFCSHQETDVRGTTVAFTVALGVGYCLHWVLNDLAVQRALRVKDSQ